jgi:hypothetical protein
MDLDKRVDFDIPAQDLPGALIQFSKQARLQVVLSDDVTRQSTRGISGRTQSGKRSANCSSQQACAIESLARPRSPSRGSTIRPR